MADDGHGTAVKFCQTRNDGLVVGVAAVAVQFDKIGEQQGDKIQRVGTLLVARNLGTLPWPEMSVKFPAQFRNLLANASQFHFGIGVAGELA